MDLVDACYHGDVSRVQELVEAGADKDAPFSNVSSYLRQDLIDQNPLMVACVQGNVNVAEYLVRKDADVNCTHEEPLLLASFKHLNILKCLLNSGRCNVDAVNNRRENVLHKVCKHIALDNDKKVKLLLAAGCRPDVCDVDGLTPLDILIWPKVSYFGCITLNYVMLRKMRFKSQFHSLSLLLKAGGFLTKSTSGTFETPQVIRIITFIFDLRLDLYDEMLKTLMLLFECGVKFSKKQYNFIMIRMHRVRVSKSFIDIIEFYLKNPLSLQSLCRLSIRIVLPKPIAAGTTERLLIPKDLERFLCMD